MGTRMVCAALAAVLAASCSTVRFDKPMPAALSEAGPLPVALAGELRGLKEFNNSGGTMTHFEVGNLLGRVFCGEIGSAPTLSLVRSTLDLDETGSRWEATYRLTLTLERDGTSQLLTAVGIGGASDFTPARTATINAMHDCALDLHRQVQAVLAEPR